MKKPLIVILVLVLLSVVSLTFSQDTSIVNYYPTQVGNVWKYHFSFYQQIGGTCYQVIIRKITGVIPINGKTYYRLETKVDSSTGTQCNGNSIDTIRVDSVTGNILRYSFQTGNCYLPHEQVLDSLRSRLHDTLETCGTPGEVCVDTTLTTIFGMNKPRKSFGLSWLEAGWSQTYVKGFGYTNYGYYGQNQYSRTLQIVGCVINGVVYGDTSFIVGLNQISTSFPESFSLSQNYPNPFNPKTVIKFQVASDKFVSLQIFDALGREIETLVSQRLKPGTYETDWDGTNYPSGVYFYQLSIGNEQLATKKMVLIK